MKELALIPMFLPAAAPCLAGVIEFRSPRRHAAALVAVALGMIDFGALWDPWGLLRLSSDSSARLCYAMTMVSATIASSAAFCSYSRRASAILVACSGLALTFFWMFNRTVT